MDQTVATSEKITGRGGVLSDSASHSNGFGKTTDFDEEEDSFAPSSSSPPRRNSDSNGCSVVVHNGQFSAGNRAGSGSTLNGSTSTLTEEALVGNLIDLGSSGDSSNEDKKVALDSARTGANRSLAPMRPVLTSSPSSGGEENFEGVANGYMNGSLLDAPLDPMRASTSSTATTTTITSNSISSPSHFTPGHKKSSSATQLASQLYNQGRSNYSGGSRRSSFNSDVEAMSVSDAELHSEISEISVQVSRIQKQLTAMEENHFTADDKHVRLKQDNAVLQERLHVLEEQMQQAEDRWKEKLNEERHRNKELQQRLERERVLEVESWTLKYHILQKEHSQIQDDNERLSQELKDYKNDCERLRESDEDSRSRVAELEAEKAELERELKRMTLERQTEIAKHSELFEELTRQNDELIKYNGRPRHASMAEKTSELEEELRRVREEHKRLQTAHEELQMERLQDDLRVGQGLLSACPSLAAEMENKDKHELIQALKDQEMCNQKLRLYIDGILIRVIERHPEILEITNKN